MVADKTTQRLSIADALDCAQAAKATRQLAMAVGFSAVASEQIVLVSAELASNIVKHAGHGALTMRTVQAHDRTGIELDAEDAGPASPTSMLRSPTAIPHMADWAMGSAVSIV